MMLHCDECGRSLSEYLYGPGGVEEVAIIGGYRARAQSIPDITCFVCINKRPNLGLVEARLSKEQT